MNQVGLFIGSSRVDLFEDEQISISLNSQDVLELDKSIGDYTQTFTLPASKVNNAIFQHWYRLDNFTTFDARIRVPATIELNSLTFRTGVLQLNNVSLKGNEPYAYSCSFYSNVRTLGDLMGDDYLYDLDFSAYNHAYTPVTIRTGMTTGLFSGNLFYPLISPLDPWYYNSSPSAHDPHNISFHNINEAHGIHYYELKPSIKVARILDAIEAKYGVTFSGSFIGLAPFTDLYLWGHRREGYMYKDQPAATAWEIIDFDATNSPSPDWFNLATDTWAPTGVSGSGALYDVSVAISTAYTNPYYFGVFRNGTLVSQAEIGPTGMATFTGIPVTNNVESLQFAIRPSTNEAMVYDVYLLQVSNASTSVISGDVYMTAPYTYAGAIVYVSDQMPEIKVKDFFKGLLTMYNLVLDAGKTSTEYLILPKQDWFAAGDTLDLTSKFDVENVNYARIPPYREIEFKYAENEAITAKQYRDTNNTGYGDLNAFFDVDGGEYKLSTPTSQPLFERLTDIGTSTLTNVLVYRHYKTEAGDAGTNLPLKGNPILMYAKSGLSVASNTIAFVNSVSPNSTTEISSVWYANTSNEYTLSANTRTLNFGAEIDPYHLVTINRGLYNEYYLNFLTAIFDIRTKLISATAILSDGDLMKLSLNDTIVWGNYTYEINSVQVNLTTGKCDFQLIPDLSTTYAGIGAIEEPIEEPAEEPTP